ncbi:MAG: hypothetical protein JSS49_05260 [Planctomycetes bacterium]|nr:hypothetical protein [Planctomycetota bacterium]
MSEIAEVVDTLDRLHSELHVLLVRGLRVCGPEHLTPLRSLHAELERIGAVHVAGRLETLINAMTADHREAAAALLRTQASLRVFERVLTIRVSAMQLESVVAGIDRQQPADFDRTSDEEDE